MRILGIDPGLLNTGYGCIDLDSNIAEPRLVEAGVLRLAAKGPVAQRLAQLYDDLSQLLGELQPQIMVVEKLFSHYRHARTSILMAHARGVVLLAGQARGITIDELAVTEIKLAITGNGHASKEQVQRAVTEQCRLRRSPDPPDVADAIAIALCAARRLAGAAAYGEAQVPRRHMR
jgi:crossover junction endodeoxyribonuclease RuvC